MTKSHQPVIDDAFVRRLRERAEIGNVQLWYATSTRRPTVYDYYTNRFERTANGWRIAKVKSAVLWMTGNFGIFQAALNPAQS